MTSSFFTRLRSDEMKASFHFDSSLAAISVSKKFRYTEYMLFISKDGRNKRMDILLFLYCLLTFSCLCVLIALFREQQDFLPISFLVLLRIFIQFSKYTCRNEKPFRDSVSESLKKLERTTRVASIGFPCPVVKWACAPKIWLIGWLLWVWQKALVRHSRRRRIIFGLHPSEGEDCFDT